jgi:hypothetical protein
MYVIIAEYNNKWFRIPADRLGEPYRHHMFQADRVINVTENKIIKDRYGKFNMTLLDLIKLKLWVDGKSLQDIPKVSDYNNPYRSFGPDSIDYGYEV